MPPMCKYNLNTKFGLTVTMCNTYWIWILHSYFCCPCAGATLKINLPAFTFVAHVQVQPYYWNSTYTVSDLYDTASRLIPIWGSCAHCKRLHSYLWPMCRCISNLVNPLKSTLNQFTKHNLKMKMLIYDKKLIHKR